MGEGVQGLVVTIDGPAGSGKSTVARRVAERLGCGVLDTGALYRTVTLLALERGIALSDAPALARLLDDFPWRQEGERFFLGEREITDDIRTADVTAHVSEVSAHPEVRARLVPVQRAQAAHRALVAEGRDMGTVVFPDARHQFYLDADLEVRARRRADEMAKKGAAADVEKLRADLRERDRKDSSRAASPLQVPEDATVIDTTDLSIEEVVDRILADIESGRQ